MDKFTIKAITPDSSTIICGLMHTVSNPTYFWPPLDTCSSFTFRYNISGKRNTSRTKIKQFRVSTDKSGWKPYHGRKRPGPKYSPFSKDWFKEGNDEQQHGQGHGCLIVQQLHGVYLQFMLLCSDPLRPKEKAVKHQENNPQFEQKQTTC